MNFPKKVCISHGKLSTSFLQLKGLEPMIKTSTEIAPAKKKMCPHPRSAQPVRKWIMDLFFLGGGQFGDADQKYCNAVMHELYKLDALEELHQPPFLVGNRPILGHTYDNHKIGWKMDQIPGHYWFFSMPTISTFFWILKKIRQYYGTTSIIWIFFKKKCNTQKNATSTYKKASKLKSQRFEEYPGSPTHPFFYMSVFLKHHLFSYWFIIIQKGRHPLFFTWFFFPFPWEYLYIYICLQICHHESLSPTLSPTLHQPHQSRSIPESCLISKRIHTTTQGELGCKDSTDLALGNPSEAGTRGYVGHVVVFCLPLKKKADVFVGNPETPTKKRKERGHSWKNPERLNVPWCYVGNCPG